MTLLPPFQTSLPTLDRLGAKIKPTEIDPHQVASEWVNQFSQQIAKGDTDGILSLLADDAWWRDLLAVTWDFRTFQGFEKIRQFLKDRIVGAGLSNFKLSSAEVDSPYPDIIYLRIRYTFDSAVGGGNGVIRLVPTAGEGGSTQWKAHTVLTNLESLKGFPELKGPLRNFAPNHGKWVDQRKHEAEFADKDPEVVVIGGSQSGLEIGARLKLLGVSTLVVEKTPRIGDQWRNRYAALCLHDVVWYDHMPYIPFPESWPVFCPAQKLADWLEFWAEAMEVNLWTSSTVTSAKKADSGKWAVTVKRGDGSERILYVNHVVFAIGVGGGTPRLPEIPGMDEFQGQILHSSAHKKATDHAGKKVVVVGACTSAHDICSDYVEHGVDVTMYQRSPTYIMTVKEGMPRLMSGLFWEGGPPTDVADLISGSMPFMYQKMMHARVTQDIKQADHALLEGLAQRGFKLTDGPDNAGFLTLALAKLGGYYLDVGASQLIIDGKIKLKSDSEIEKFTKTGLKFKNGSELETDVVLFATGWADARTAIREIVGDELGKQINRIWGFNEEGELNSVWREIGVENLWCMMGNFAWCRFYSRHLALQIKAKQEGVFGVRYAAPVLN